MRMKKMSLIIGVLSLALVLVMLPRMVACASEEVKIIKTGASLPMNSSLGVETKKCMEIFVDLTNKAGGVVIGGQRYKFEWICYDDKYQADAGRAAAERLVYRDKVQFIVGELASPAIMAQLPIYEKERIPSFFDNSTSKIEETDKWHLTFKRHASSVGGLANIFIWKNHPEIKTGVYFTPDDEAGYMNVRPNTPQLEAIGIKMFDPVYFPRDTIDFSPFATKIVSMNPDMVRFGGSEPGTKLGLQLKALYQAGFKGLKATTIVNMAEALPTCGKEAIEGMVLLFTDPTQYPEPTELALTVRKIYEEKYGKWIYTGINWASSWYLFLAAIEKADSLDPDDIVAAVEGMEYEHPLWGPTRMIRRPFMNDLRTVSGLGTENIGVIKDGKITLGGQITVDQNLSFAKQFCKPAK